MYDFILEWDNSTFTCFRCDDCDESCASNGSTLQKHKLSLRATNEPLLYWSQCDPCTGYQTLIFACQRAGFCR